MASTAVSNHLPTNNIHRGKKKHKTSRSIIQNQNNNNVIKWKSEQQQQLYSSKLLIALSQLRISQPSSANKAHSGRAVREAADKALAVTAKGRTLWSRAILKNRIRLKFRKQKRQRGSVVAAETGSKRSRVSVSELKVKNLSAVQRKVKVLSRLVPGCRKETLPVVLEEASDYIAALEMQVRAMTAVAELLSGSSSTSSAPPT